MHWQPHLNSSISVHVGLPQQSPRLSAGEVVAESPEDVDDLRGVNAVAVVFVVEGEGSLDRLQKRRTDLRWGNTVVVEVSIASGWGTRKVMMVLVSG